MDEQQPEILKYFKWDHLPPKLADISEPFGRLAHDLVLRLPNGAERAVALRKLLEAKDAAVRAAL